MPVIRYVQLHDQRVLWPEHLSLESVLELQTTTPEYIFETTYNGNMVQPSGAVFKREWWDGKNRYHLEDLQGPVPNPSVARYISLDTASSEAENAAYTAWAVGDLLADYHLAIIEIGRARLDFPDLIGYIQGLYDRYQTYDELLYGIIIEDKSSGIGALQTLKQAGNIASILKGFNPRVDKPTRWSQAAVWCKLGCVWLPWPAPQFPWLLDAEEELFTVPGAPQLDQADAFSQLILFLENLLAEGNKARNPLLRSSNDQFIDSF